MKHFVLFVSLYFSFSFLIIAQTPDNIPQFQTFYVSETGQDAGHTGTYEEPFATITYALNQVNYNYAGLIIKVIKGQNGYNQYVNINKSGNANFPIIIQAENPNNKPVFYGRSSAFFGKNAVFEWSTGINYVTIDGINVFGATANSDTSGLYGIWIRGDYNTIRNCHLDTISRSGIEIQGCNNLIELNTIRHITGIIRLPGINDTTWIAGNNIEITTIYRTSGNSVRADSNIIRNNKLTDNTTHFGISIIPDSRGPQNIMYGNKICNNYINSTGGGIYTRYQRDFDIINNVIANSVQAASQYADWITTGGGISFKFLDNADFTIIENSNVKVLNNTIVNNYSFGIDNRSTNNISIKNNIIVNNRGFHIVFRRFYESISADIKTNLYYSAGCTPQWIWDGIVLDSTGWDTTCEPSAIIRNPLLTNQGNPYTIQLHSPAKNNGTPLAEVTKDINGINRPYWEKGVDIGAYELDEAQIRIGTLDVNPGQDITHNINALGTYWEKNGTSWPISTASDISASSYTTIGTTSSDKETWDGFHIKWLRNSDNQAPIGHAFYKVSNSSDNHHFYLDFRDAVEAYNPNIYIRYDNINQSRYEYFDGNSFQPIADGSILRIWNITEANNPNTNNLNSYLGNMLVKLEDDNHPRLVWGPYASNNQYTLRRVIGENKPENIISNQNILEYLDQTLDLSSPEYLNSTTAQYNVLSNNMTSNTASYWVTNLEKENQAKNLPSIFKLYHNYPNPFNPNTTIRYSIKDAGIVKLEIFDILGKRIATIVNEEMPAGEYEVRFNGNHLSSGIYFFKLASGTFTDIKKMQLIK